MESATLECRSLKCKIYLNFYWKSLNKYFVNFYKRTQVVIGIQERLNLASYIDVIKVE